MGDSRSAGWRGVSKGVVINRIGYLIVGVVVLALVSACEEDLTPPQFELLDSLGTLEPGVYAYKTVAWICPDADTIVAFEGVDTLCVGRNFTQPFLPCDIIVNGDTATAQCVVEDNPFFPACQTTSNFYYEGSFNGSHWFFNGYVGNVEPQGTCIYYYECLAVTIKLTRIGDPPPPCGEPEPEKSWVTLVVGDGPGGGQVETGNLISNFVTQGDMTRVYVRAVAERDDGYEYFIEFLTPPLSQAPVTVPATEDFHEPASVGVMYADGRMSPFQSFSTETVTGRFSFLSMTPHYLAGTFELVIDGKMRGSGGSEAQRRLVSGLFQVAEPASQRRITGTAAGMWIFPDKRASRAQ